MKRSINSIITSLTLIFTASISPGLLGQPGQLEYEFYARPEPSNVTNEQHLQRIAVHNAKLSSLKEYRERLRGEMVGEIGKPSTHK